MTGKRQTDRQTDRQIDKETSRQIDRQPDSQTSTQVLKQTGRQSDKLKVTYFQCEANLCILALIADIPLMQPMPEHLNNTKHYTSCTYPIRYKNKIILRKTSIALNDFCCTSSVQDFKAKQSWSSWCLCLQSQTNPTALWRW